MMHLAQRLALAAAVLPGIAVPAAVAQSVPASVAVTAVRNFSPMAYRADGQNWAVAEDNRGILYFGNTNGVLEFDGTRWRLIELPGKRGAYALGKSADGRILLGSEGEVGWLAPDQAGSMVYVSKADGLPEAFRSAGDRMVQILDTPTGQVFLSDHWLFIRSSGGALSSYHSDDHFLQAAWFQGSLYVLDSARGLLRLDSDVLKDIASGARIRGVAMLTTDTGLLIPSYNDGLIRYSPNTPNHWQVLNAAGWSTTDGSDVTSGVVLNKNLMALGTAKHGVILINADGKVLQRIGAAEGLTDASVYGIYYDNRGGLWLASDNGLSLVGLNLPRDAAAVPFHSWVRSVVGTRDERLLFGGTYFADPSGVQQLAQGKAQKLVFPYDYNAFRFDYSANGLEASGQMQFQTYMEGVDKGWSSWSTRSEREFTSLNHGAWIFKVRSRKADGVLSSEGVYEFTVRPAWYDTWWFAVFQVLFVLGLLIIPSHTPHKGLQDALTTFAVIVPFIYLGDALLGFVDHYYSSEVVFFKILMSAGLSALLDPIQNYLKKHVHHRNTRHAARRSRSPRE